MNRAHGPLRYPDADLKRCFASPRATPSGFRFVRRGHVVDEQRLLAEPDQLLRVNHVAVAIIDPMAGQCIALDPHILHFRADLVVDIIFDNRAEEQTLV